MIEPRRQYEPLELLEFKSRLQADIEEHQAGFDPPFGDHSDEDEIAGEVALSPALLPPYSNENLVVASVDDRHWPLRNRKRPDRWLYMAVIALVVAAILALLVFRPGGTTLPSANHTDTASAAKAAPDAENSTQSLQLKTSSGAAGQAEMDSGVQPASTPLLQPIGDPSSAAPMTEADRSKLFVALNRYADSQSAPVQAQPEAPAAAAPKRMQGAAGARPHNPPAATLSQRPDGKEKVVALLAKHETNAALSPAVAPACVAPSPSVIRNAVLKRIRGPASAQFGAATVLCGNKIEGAPVRIICGSMSPRNAFGGYERWMFYLLIAEIGFVEVPAQAQDWNRYCGGPYKSSVTVPDSELNASQL